MLGGGQSTDTFHGKAQLVFSRRPFLGPFLGSWCMKSYAYLQRHPFTFLWRLLSSRDVPRPDLLLPPPVYTANTVE